MYLPAVMIVCACTFQGTVVAVASQQYRCPSGWYTFSSSTLGIQCYRFVSEYLYHNDAARWCSTQHDPSMKARLVTYRDGDLWFDIQRRVREWVGRGGKDFWVGLVKNDSAEHVPFDMYPPYSSKIPWKNLDDTAIQGVDTMRFDTNRWDDMCYDCDCLFFGEEGFVNSPCTGHDRYRRKFICQGQGERSCPLLPVPDRGVLTCAGDYVFPSDGVNVCDLACFDEYVANTSDTGLLRCLPNSTWSGQFQCIRKCQPGEQYDYSVEGCRPCPRGTYKAHEYQVWCAPCPMGSTTVIKGAVSAEACVRAERAQTGLATRLVVTVFPLLAAFVIST